MPREGTKTYTSLSVKYIYTLRLDMPREGTKTNAMNLARTKGIILRLDMPREGTKTLHTCSSYLRHTHIEIRYAPGGDENRK